MIELKRIMTNIKLLKAVEKRAKIDHLNGFCDKYYGKLEESSLEEYKESLVKDILDQYKALFGLMSQMSGQIYRINELDCNIKEEGIKGHDDDRICFSEGFILGKGTSNREIYLQRKKLAEERGKKLCIV